MNKKIIPITIAALLGAGLGAFLSYGPLRQYKSEAVINVEMGTAEYKQFLELANDPINLKKYASQTKPLMANDAQLEVVIQDTKKADWFKPVLKITKADYKDLPDAVIRLEQENIKRRDLLVELETEKIFGKDANLKKAEFYAYNGLRISGVAIEPQLAADKVTWLSKYAFDVAVKDAVNTLIAKWTKDNKLFNERFQVKKIQQESEAEFLKLKVIGLKKSIANYPDAAKKEMEQSVEAGQDFKKTMTPQAQMLSVEIDLLEIDVQNQKMDRAKEQQNMVEEIIKQVALTKKEEKNGLDRLKQLDEILTNEISKSKTQAKREKLLLMIGEISNIKSRFQKNVQYILLPTLPIQQDGPAPIKLIILMGLLCAALMAAYQWRVYILQLIKQEDFKIIENNSN